MEQQRLFEGFEVHSQFARLKTWQIEDEDEHHFTIGDTVVFCGTAIIEPPSMAFDKDGNLKRTNVLSPVVIRVADGAMRNELVEFFGLVPESGQLNLPAPSAAALASNSATHVADEDPEDLERVDQETGEILDEEEELERFLAGGTS